MNFTHPAHLWGLLALAIPIVIHLFNFKRFKKIWFTNVERIRELSEETRKQSRIRHLIILLLRLLAIASLVMVFSGPYIPNKEAGASAGKRKLVSIYLDNSFSMEMRDSDNMLLETAKSMIPGIVENYSEEDLFRFITNDLKPEHNHLMTAKELNRYAASTKLSPTAIPLSAILDRFREVPDEATLLSRDHYVLSDMQKSSTDLSKIVMDTTARTRLIALKAEKSNNIYPDSCWFDNPINLKNQMLTLHCRMVNTSDQALEKIPVKLLIDGKQKALSTINIPAQGSANAQFTFKDHQTGIRKAEIAITDFPVTYDDRLYLTYEIMEKINVLIVNEKQQNKYLTALFAGDTIFHLTNITAGQLSPSLLERHNLIILNGLHNPGSGLATELQKEVEKGKSVVLIPGKEAHDKDVLSSLFDFEPLLAYDTNQVRVDKIAVLAPFFHDVFLTDQLEKSKLPNKTDLPFVTGYYPSSLTDFKAQKLMTLANGVPFLSLKKRGNGFVYRFTAPLNENNGNFIHHALFVPVFYRMAFLSIPRQSANVIIGTDDRVTVTMPQSDAEGIKIVSDQDQFTFIPGISKEDGGVALLFHKTLSKAGFYHVVRETPNGEHITYQQFAVNFNRKESDLECYTLQEGEELLDKLGLHNFSILQAPPHKIQYLLKTLDHGQNLWHYFVYFCLLLLLAEVILLRIWK
ncbi:MAG: hypothetical protein CSA95_00970 [Bacteroidetes bacterium]|nr:MAG: hypothetical protein CSA95_00970 [Bacteroidota bacterium]